MFHVVLVEPQIPPNTGNIIRLCANTGCHLHLVEPLGFPLDDAKMRRAGLDYHEFASVQIYTDWDNWLARCAPDLARVFLFTTKGQQNFAELAFQPGDWFIFGAETHGVSEAVRQSIPSQQHLCLPMLAHSRSLNLSNTVAVAVYEAWRQQGFKS
jgi:tRNA (cytidine/uridine-2'-O-)-methyltransferase